MINEPAMVMIETEVVPFVDKNYRTQPYRTIAGHSLAGLFVVYALLERPDVFNAYIAASPHLQWDKHFLLKQAEGSLRKRFESDKVLYVGLGDEPDYLAGFNQFQELLKRAKPKGLEYEFQQFKNENHGSVVLPAYYAGLRKVYAGWTPPANGTLADLEGHFRKLSARYGYEIKVPEALMNRIGYQLLRTERTAEAIEVFKKNAANYPRSANVYDSLAEAYEKNGQKTNARDNYEKAWKMAESNGENQLAVSAKGNFERIAAGVK